MVFKYVSCDSWVIQLVPERHLGGWQDLLVPAPPSTPGAYSAMPSRSRPAPCLPQMWFIGQGSLLKQLSANGRSFQCCRVPGTLCGLHPWRISKASPATVKQASVLPFLYSSGCLCLLPGFLLQALVTAWYQVRPSLTGLPRLGALPPQCSPWMT